MTPEPTATDAATEGTDAQATATRDTATPDGAVRQGVWGELVTFRRQEPCEAGDGVPLTVGVRGGGVRPADEDPKGSTQRHLVRAGELVYLRQGAAAGVAAVSHLGGTVSVNFPVGALTGATTPGYTSLLLRSPRTIAAFAARSAGTAQPFLSETAFCDVPVAWHRDPDEQQRVVDAVAAADAHTEALGWVADAARRARDVLANHLLGQVEGTVALGEVLTARTERVEIDDDTWYTQVTVSNNGRGMSLRERRQGRDIGTKKQLRLHAGDLVVSKLGAGQGALCVVPERFDGATVTADFPSFRPDDGRVDGRYLDVVVRGPRIAATCAALTGGTGQGRVDMRRLLQVEVPLPDLDGQARIADAVAAADAYAEAAARRHVRAATVRDQLLVQLLDGTLSVAPVDVD